MKLVWSKRSRSDLASIRRYIFQRNPQAADRVIDTLLAAAKRLETFPQLGRPSELSDVRLLKIPRIPYLMPYRVQDDAVEVLAVLHERRERPEEWS